MNRTRTAWAVLVQVAATMAACSHGTRSAPALPGEGTRSSQSTEEGEHAAPASAAPRDQSTTRDRLESGPLNVIAKISTVAGTLRILDVGAARGPEFEACQFDVQLESRVIFRTDCRSETDPNKGQPVISVLKVVPQRVPPFDEVVVFQQNGLANACNGGPIWLLGLSKDGGHRISQSIDFCGGRDPIVTAKGDSVDIALIGTAARGSGKNATERWIYQGGQLRKVGR